jgi:MFS family permease
MNPYNVALFLHVIGAIGYSAAVVVTLLGLIALRRATRVEQVRSIVGIIGLSDPVAIVGALLILTAGLYMTITVWGWQMGWINVALVSVALTATLGVAVIESRRKAIAKLLQEDDPPVEELNRRIHDPVLGTGLYTLVGLVIGIIFLMTNKPALEDSILVIVISGALGLAASLPLWRNRRTSVMIDSTKPIS